MMLTSFVGVAVSSTGRMFSNYPLGLDPNNTRYQVAELHDNNTETPYPSLEINTPPGGAINYSTTPPTGVNYEDYLIAVQSVVIDSKDRLWILDTGRPALPSGMQVSSSEGGPKLIGVDLNTDTVFTTITFPRTVAYPDTYLNDIRFDLKASSSSSGQGIGYITDSDPMSPNGIIIVDLGTGESWRHLDNNPAVRPQLPFHFYVWGETVYQGGTNGLPLHDFTTGSDGITISPDGETLYFSPISSRDLYAVPTARLRDNGPSSELLAAASVVNLCQKGISDGLESDSNGIVYAGSLETNSIVTYSPHNGTFNTYVRGPMIEWTDTFSVAGSYLYFTENQLWRTPNNQAGVDRRVKPYSLYRVPLAGDGQKITLE